MPKIVVQIEWDKPDEPHWLNPDDVQIAMGAYCPNTAFTITDIRDVVEALNWLVHLHMGVSKDGGQDICETEWQQAIDEGVATLVKLEATGGQP